MHTIPMKIVLCTHTKCSRNNKYNGINNNIVYNYTIIVFVFVIMIIITNITIAIINSITLITHIIINEFAFNLKLCN